MHGHAPVCAWLAERFLNRLPLSTLGLLQYLAPVFQFLIGILHFHETMSTEQWIGFLLVWAALVLLTADALRNARAGVLRGREELRAQPSPTASPGGAPVSGR